MLKSLIRFVKGYLYVELRGKSPERFINLCRHHNIYVWNMKIKDGKCTFKIYVSDYKRLLQIVAKTRTYPHIIKKYGLAFAINELLKRKTLLPAIILFVVVLYSLSFIVWDITITGQCRHTFEELNEYLEKNGYKPGMIRKNVDCKELEDAIRSEYNDISWVSVELSGCNIHVNVIESDIMENQLNNDNNCSDIIASSDGVVESIVTRAGTPLVSVGDVVTKGQVLVSGLIELYDDGGNVTNSKYVFADADVFVNTSLTYKDNFSMIYDEKVYTGRKKNSYNVVYKDKIFFIENLLNEFECYRKYDIIKTSMDISLMDIMFDTFVFEKVTHNEYEIISKTYTNEQAYIIARNNLHQYLCDLSEDNIQINDKKVSMKITDGMCISSGDIYVTQKQELRQDINYDNHIQDDNLSGNGLESDNN